MDNTGKKINTAGYESEEFFRIRGFLRQILLSLSFFYEIYFLVLRLSVSHVQDYWMKVLMSQERWLERWQRKALRLSLAIFLAALQELIFLLMSFGASALVSVIRRTIRTILASHIFTDHL